MKVIHLVLVIMHLIGHLKSHLAGFIAEGHDADVRNFPYCAFLSIKCTSKGEKKLMCGSSIVNQYFTLTAAHCTDECRDQNTITVLVGDDTEFSNASGVATATRFHIHEYYDELTLSNDIALVKLKTPLKLSWKVSRVALMEKPPYNEKALVAGWGLTNENNKQVSKALQYTEQYVMNLMSCFKIFKVLNDGTFCASNKYGYVNRGDSGSALVVRGYIQIGIVSYKMKNSTYETKKVTVYTDTGYFYNWIKRTQYNILCN